MKNKLTKLGILAIICLLVVNFGFLIIINKKTSINKNASYDYVVHIIYQENHFQGSKMETAQFYAGTNDKIYINFYNLDVNETYAVESRLRTSLLVLGVSGVVKSEFTNRTKIFIGLWVLEFDWVCLLKNQEEIICIWIK